MKKVIYIYASLFSLLFIKVTAQIGVNTIDPKSTLDIFEENPENSLNNSGIIIPRVKALNNTDPKEKGLLVFFDSSNQKEKGFRWWNDTNWIPFVSINTVASNKVITYVGTQEVFSEGVMNNLPATDVRTLRFNNIETNDNASFELNAAGELVVKKEGYYHLQAVANISKLTNTLKRDQLDMKIYINGNDASVIDSENFNIEGTKGFAPGPNSIGINAAGVIKLQANNRLSMKIVRSYRDVDPNDEITITPDTTSSSNIVLNYLGSF